MNEQEKQELVDEVVRRVGAEMRPVDAAAATEFAREVKQALVAEGGELRGLVSTIVEDKLRALTYTPAEISSTWGKDVAEEWRRAQGRVAEVVRFVIPAEMHPDRAGHVCPAVIANEANERNEADLVVFLFGVGPQSIAAVPFDDDDEQAPGTWHRLPYPGSQLA